MALTLGHVALSVSDLDRSIAFYGGLLGFSVVRIVDCPPEGKLGEPEHVRGWRTWRWGMPFWSCSSMHIRAARRSRPSALSPLSVSLTSVWHRLTSCRTTRGSRAAACVSTPSPSSTDRASGWRTSTGRTARHVSCARRLPDAHPGRMGDMNGYRTRIPELAGREDGYQVVARLGRP